MSAPDKIKELVDRFERNIDAYTKGNYNETQTRREFIDPFFAELGWDVDNRDGYAEAYKDVVHEDAIKVGTKMKAPDYSFRIGGVRKFFLEAKKPSINIRDDVSPAYQLRRYAWSAKLPLSILTDFEELAVYDCRYRPFPKDKAATSRIKYVKYHDYLERWDEIYDVFSKESILKGSFDKFADSAKGKKGTAEVDSEFLKEIEKWRDFLARNLALRNSQLSQRELNFAVQKTIDRIIFLRICEDRGIEQYGRLGALQNGANVYERLLEYFRAGDAKYNSGLFHFAEEKGRAGEKDILTPNLKIDDKVFKEIVQNLYYPECPYEFSVLSADILGQVYEQFLGKVIHLTKGHQAKVEEKPEVRKAGGVYYTPKYIVDYIVKNTVGKLLEDIKSPTSKKLETLRVLDPACGSGSFLLGAYQYLLDWHLKQYIKDTAKFAKGRKPKIRQTSTGDWRLTIDERKRILLNNIYGVDIDSQAVEVTKLSLLLKVLEDENDETLNNQLTFSFGRERVLPDLCNNIKCGNSLVGPDFYDGKDQTDLFDEDAVLRVNAFDWDAEFAEIMLDGGFDAVIGNPPWGANFTNQEQEYFTEAFDSAGGRNIESYAIFTEQSLRKLLKTNGFISLITPDTFLRKDDYLEIRKLFIEKSSIEELIETGPVFSKVRDTWCLIFRLRNDKPRKTQKINHIKICRFIVSAEERLRKFGHAEWDIKTQISQFKWINSHNLIIGYLASENAQNIITKIEKFPRLKDLSDRFIISRGEEGSKYALIPDPKGNFNIVIPADVNRYSVNSGISISDSDLTPTKVESIYKHPKIWIIRIQKMRWQQRIVCSFDSRKNSAGMKTLQTAVSTTDNAADLKYLLGILSSKLINYWCINYLADDINKTYLQKVPICTSSSVNFEKMVTFIDNMLDLNKKLPVATVPQVKTTIQRQIDSTDKQIDQLVYKLYDLTEDEIKTVEGE